MSWSKALESLNGVIFREFGSPYRVTGVDFDQTLDGIFWMQPAATNAGGETMPRPQPMLALRRSSVGSANLIGGRVIVDGKSWPIVRLARIPEPGDDEIRYELGFAQ